MRKRYWILASLLLVSLLLGACAQPTPEMTEEPATEEPMEEEEATEEPMEEEEEATEEATEEPMEEEEEEAMMGGGDMVVAHDGSSEPALLDAQIDPYHETGLIDSFITDSLVCRDPDTMEIKAWLATDWNVSDDGLTWTFNLREDVTFHDGTPFNAEAAKANFDRILDPDTMSVEAAARLGPVESVEVVDEYTLQFTHERPYAAFLDAFSILMEPMWSPTALEEYGDDFPNHLIGTGPFMFEENVPKDHVTVVRNPDYNWAPACVDHEGPAYLDSFTFKWVTEDAVRAGIVKTGEAHVADLPAQYVSDYEGEADYAIVTGYQPGTGLQWVMNTAKEPLSDINVRKAILHGVDRDAINQMLYDGRYLPSYGPMIPGTTCYWEGMEDVYPYDPAQAGQMLEDAGWTLNESTGIREKDGEPLVVRWTALHHEEIGEALAAQMVEIGIDLKVEKVAGPVQIDMATRRDFDLMYERQRGNEPVFLDMIWNSKNSGEGGWAWTGFADERMDELLDAAQEETDSAARCEMYTEVQQIIMENALTLGLFGQPRFWVQDKAVSGFELGPTAWIYYPYMLSLEQ
jgi:peptide/nickel transport system substrate-binding protein